jgi:hypothetical protein
MQQQALDPIAPRDQVSVPRVEKDQKKELGERMIGILLLVESLESFQKLRETFEKVVGSFENAKQSISEQHQKEIMFQCEQVLGELPDMMPAYVRAFMNDSVSYELLGIDTERKRLSEILGVDPGNTDILKQMHTLQVRKDELVRTRH